jgi:ATP-dependent Clp protease ATP-binding subunit ClpC
MNPFWKKKTDRDSAPVATPSIYDLARSVGDRLDEVAHPAELLEDEKFSRAVATLASGSLSLEELRTFALGENAAVASLAICALGRRGDPAAVPFLLDSINRFSAKPASFFGLHALEQLVPPPQTLVGRVIVAFDDLWSDGGQRQLAQYAREFVQRRAAGGETLTFGDALDNISAGRRHDVGALLEILGDIASPLREDFETFDRRVVNVDYLRTIGTVWKEDDAVSPAIEHEGLTVAANVIEQWVSASNPRSVIVAGDDGVGKTTAIRTAARRLLARGWTIFEAGANELIAGQSYIGELEGRLQKLLKTIRRPRRVIWLLPRFHELLLVGQHRFSQAGVLDVLLPEIDSGAITVIGEIGTGPYQRLIEQKRRIASSFATMRIRPSSEAATLDLARHWSKAHSETRPLMSESVLAEAWQLTTQFLGMRSSPGNLLGLLELTLARRRAAGSTEIEIGADDLLVTLSDLTGLPNTILDDREGLDLTELRNRFSDRVLGQPEAVEVLVERVAMIKAGVTDPTRPFGVFLFAGPTGTGKTEIAKTLAEFLFGSPDRMIRLDMSEFKSVDSLSRLLGDEQSGSSSLVDAIRKQPFSLLLLDEFEKAHPNVWDLFLQLFDDGRLTDRRGVTADFRHALIIMTSNIGSAIQTLGRVGFSETSAGAFQTMSVMKALEREFRKEFINRIDRVVVFRPLSRDTMRGILRRELAGVFRRRGLRNRNWAVEWDERAIEFLLSKGFTDDLGARPLKRSVERHVLTPLAEMIVSRSIPSGDQFLFIRTEGDRLQIDFVDPDATTTPEIELPADSNLEDLILDAHGSAADVECLHRQHAALTAIVTTANWNERKSIALSMTSLPEFWSSGERFEILGEAEMHDRIEKALAGAGSMLERIRAGGPARLVQHVARQLWLIRIAIDDIAGRRPAEAVLGIEARPEMTSPGEANAWAMRLTGMYRQWATRRGMKLQTLRETTGNGVTYTFFATVSGFGAHTLLSPEAGLHILEVPAHGRFDRVTARVRVAPVPYGEVPIEDLIAMILTHSADPLIVRRYRDEPSALVRDSVRNFRTGRIDIVMRGDFDVVRAARL